MHTTNWRRVWTYYGLALGLHALLSVPLWLDSRGLKAPYFPLIAVAAMWTPGLAGWLCAQRGARPDRRSYFAWRRPARAWSSVALALLLPLFFSLGAIAVGTAFGVYAFDPALSAHAEQVGKALDHPARYAAGMIALSTAAGFFNAVPALGEELGWRGALFYELRHLPAWRADSLTGVLWGLWHAPLILLGYNYPSAPVLGALLWMPCFCIPMAVWVGWLRRRSASVFICALAHGATNSTATLALLFYRAGHVPDAVHATITGWTGWLLPTAFGLWLYVSGRAAGAEPSPNAVAPESASSRTEP